MPPSPVPQPESDRPAVRRRLPGGRFGRAALAGLVIVAVGVGLRATPPTLTPLSDIALLESFTIQAEHGQALLGPHSRYGWHHPGPLLFYLLAPLHLAAGGRTVALFAGAALLNAVALAACVWIAWRYLRGSFAVVASALAAFYVFRIQDSIATAWTPHVLPLPMMALVLLAAVVAAGHVRLLPALVFVATFLVQTHVGTVPTVAAVCVAALAGVVLWPDPSRPGRDWPAFRRAAGWAAVVLALTWALPLIDQVSHHPGNVTRLVAFFTGDTDPPGSPVRARAFWAEMLVGAFRHGFVVSFGQSERPSFFWGWPWFALVQLVFVAVAVVGAGPERQRAQRALGGLLLVASAVSWWSTLQIRGELFGYLVFWISALGILNAAYVLSFVIESLSGGAVWPSRASAVASAALLVVGLGFFWQPVRAQIALAWHPPGGERTARQLSERLAAYRVEHGLRSRPLLRFDVGAVAVASGLVVELQKAGESFAVEPDWVPVFTDRLAPRGDEAWVLTVADQATTDRLRRADPAATPVATEGRFSLFVSPLTVPPG